MQHRLHQLLQMFSTDVLLQENVALIREINELRREIKNIRHVGVKPPVGIGAGWGSGKSPRRSTKEAKQDTLPPLPAGSVTDCLRLSVPCLSACLSPCLELLAAEFCIHGRFCGQACASVPEALLQSVLALSSCVTAECKA